MSMEGWIESFPAGLREQVIADIDAMGNDAPLSFKRLWGYLQSGRAGDDGVWVAEFEAPDEPGEFTAVPPSGWQPAAPLKLTTVECCEMTAADGHGVVIAEQDLPDDLPEWRSSDPEVLTVEAVPGTRGRYTLTARKPGHAELVEVRHTAEADSAEVLRHVEVTEAPPFKPLIIEG